ncbi:MAG: hypothetical protein JWO59_3370, partial [Chloroflexi bacterium]|nr:hypothetical protein [Chloroflexota bacterium]
MASRKPVPPRATSARSIKAIQPDLPVDDTPPKRKRSRSNASLAPLPSLVDVAAGNSRVDRWRDVARLVIVTIGVSLALMVTNRTAVGPDILSALDWGAYLLPPVLVSVGLDILRRSAHERPLLRFEEINGIIALFLAGIVAFGSQHHGGPIG